MREHGAQGGSKERGPTPAPGAAPVFLRAEWRHLAMLHFAVDPTLLEPLVPRGTELDAFAGTTYLSVVGFLFLDTRVLGLRVPFHSSFEEVNARFYVRRKAGEGWRRAVVFVRELVPRAAIAFVARTLYHERYLALPMRHRLDQDAAGRIGAATYAWRSGGVEGKVEVVAETEPLPTEPGSEEEFLVDHAWGYSRRRDGATFEYRVSHPTWNVRRGRGSLVCDAERLYGPRFGAALCKAPASAFLVDGSAVLVHRGRVVAR